MKSSSYTSNVLSYITLPKPRLRSAKFVYGFYTRDEKINEGVKPVLAFSLEKVRGQRKRSPRYVVVDLNFPNEVGAQLEGRPATDLIRNNLGRIYSAEDVGNTSATTIVVQDTGLLERAYATVIRSAKARGIEGNQTDIALELGKILGESVDRKLIQDLASRFSERGAQFVSEKSVIGSGKFSEVRSSMVSYTVSDKFVLDVAKSGEDEGSPGPTAATARLRKDLGKFQSEARKEVQAISSNDYVTVFEPVSVRRSSAGEFIDKTELLGCLVYRKETKPDGSEETRILDILPAGANAYIDHEIKYGATYHYWAHAVYAVTTNSLSVNTGQVVIAKILFQSESSEVYSVRTTENVPPPYPADFGLRWDYQNRQLVMSWAFPNNPQRDIKYFQVFRRSNLLEPFKLLFEYDFNDSLSPPVRREEVLTSNSVKVNDPLLVYVDSDFRKDSDFIYCVASVDARGFVSNYSQQLRATFDTFRNKLIVEPISIGGAPRPYPNIFLKSDFFLDSVVTSNKRRMKVYFDPEYLKLTDRDGKDQNLFSLGDRARYKVTVVDIERAEQAVATLTIKDLRRA